VDNWDTLIFYVGMVALLIWALYFTTTVVDELRELNRQAGDSKQELKEIKQLLQQLIRDR